MTFKKNFYLYYQKMILKVKLCHLLYPRLMVVSYRRCYGHLQCISISFCCSQFISIKRKICMSQSCWEYFFFSCTLYSAKFKLLCFVCLYAFFLFLFLFFVFILLFVFVLFFAYFFPLFMAFKVYKRKRKQMDTRLFSYLF